MENKKVSDETERFIYTLCKCGRDKHPFSTLNNGERVEPNYCIICGSKLKKFK